jgi:predicted metal-dependent HD superfamily phosphohydrolase
VLKETYIRLLTNFTDDKSLTIDLWAEIEHNYSSKKRHYHTLSHLDNLLKQLLEVKEKIENWETVLFTLYYHDIIYNTLKSDNEEQSAKLAEKRMKQINVPTEIIENCKSQILATKKHQDSSDIDSNYFLDADLSVLGQDTETYKVYFQNVRKEYSIYPDLIYNPGRKKVLKHFLELKRIFKTEYFYAKYENQAKQNLQTELEQF